MHVRRGRVTRMGLLALNVGTTRALRVDMKLAMIAVLVAACDSTSLARLAKTPDVTTCTPLGEAVVDPASGTSSDDHLTALRRKAALAGATDVIAEGDLKGRMFKCDESGDDVTMRPSHGGGGF
jgi:hypothetical protein